jgi:hypothetical protein
MIKYEFNGVAESDATVRALASMALDAASGLR